MSPFFKAYDTISNSVTCRVGVHSVYEVEWKVDKIVGYNELALL